MGLSLPYKATALGMPPRLSQGIYNGGWVGVSLSEVHLKYAFVKEPICYFAVKI